MSIIEFWLRTVWLFVLSLIFFSISIMVAYFTQKYEAPAAQPIITVFAAIAAFLFCGGFAYNQARIMWLWHRLPIEHFPYNKEQARENKPWALKKLRFRGVEVIHQNFLQGEAEWEIKRADETLAGTTREEAISHWTFKKKSAEEKRASAYKKGRRLYKKLKKLHILFLESGLYMSRDLELKKFLDELREEFIILPKIPGLQPTFKRD